VGDKYGVQNTDNHFILTPLAPQIQSEFPALYDKDVENYEQRVHVTRRLIYIVHGDRRSSYSKSKAGRIEKKRETEMCKYVSVLFSQISAYYVFSTNDYSLAH